MFPDLWPFKCITPVHLKKPGETRPHVEHWCLRNWECVVDRKGYRKKDPRSTGNWSGSVKFRLPGPIIGTSSQSWTIPVLHLDMIAALSVQRVPLCYENADLGLCKAVTAARKFYKHTCADCRFEEDSPFINTVLSGRCSLRPKVSRWLVKSMAVTQSCCFRPSRGNVWNQFVLR